MRYPLGQTDLTISGIGLGCVTFGREIDEPTSQQIADHALSLGINLFDTAEGYHAGESERVLGRWIKDRGVRDQIVICTKASPTGEPLRKERILRAAHRSLENLQLDDVDLYYLHVHPEDEALEECLEAIDLLQKQGKTKAVACSNFNADQLRHAVDLQQASNLARFQALQPNYNLVYRDIESATLPYCTQQQIATIGYSPLGAGFLTGKYSRDGDVPEGARFEVIPGHQGVYFHDDKWRVMEGLRAMSEAAGVSMIHLALAWVLRRPRTTCTLIGARTPAHVDQAFIALEHPDIDDAMLDQLTALSNVTSE